MGGKLSDEKRKLILADYIACQNYREVARKYNVAVNTVKNIALECTDVARQCTQKQEENTQDTLTFMQEQHELKKEILQDILKAMGDKAKKPDMFTNIKDLATAYGILLDKELKFAEVSKGKEKPEPIEIILRRKNADD